MEDAKEKVLVAPQVFEELPRAFQKKLIVDSKTELAFHSRRHSAEPAVVGSAPEC